MPDTSRALRLDEILLRDGLVTEAQLSAALQRQKLYGGRLGTQLLHLRFIDEAALIGVLSNKLGCEGVVLTNLDISDTIVQMVPATVAVARKVMPFAYDDQQNILKVACEDPTNPDLINELKFVSAGKTVKLFVAAELALNVAIAKYYLGREMAPEFGSGVFDVAGNPLSGSGGMTVSESRQTKGSILLVTDDASSGAQLQSMLERDHFKVVRTDSADDAIQIIGNHKFHSVFIQDTVPGDYIDLIDRLRKISPKTRVRYYESAASLMLSLDAGVMESELLIKNLELFTSLLSSTGGANSNHSARVGQYVEKLCRRLELADKDRLVITNAAYLHDLAKFYYGSAGYIDDHRTHIDLTVKLLNSLNYSPLVIEILRSMYINLREKFTKRLPIEVLGGNILTVTDIFCETIQNNVSLSLDKFDAIKRKYRQLVGKLFLSEVVEAFIAMIQEEILAITQLEKYSQVMLYGTDKDQLANIELRIKSAGFRTVAEQDLVMFVELFKRSRPDIVILLECGSAASVQQLVENLIQRNVPIDRVPTFLLTEGALATQMSPLLEQGIEDVIPADDNLNLLLIKMKKIQARIEAKAREREEVVQQSGAVGHLEDMNLIDLLQALGPSRKTAKLTINVSGKKLVIFLNLGDIIFAECGDKIGADAVYEGISWTSGTWNIQPVALADLPDPNNAYSNESIMMEGCRLLDESGRVKQTEKTPN